MKKILSVVIVLILFAVPVLAGDKEASPGFFQSEAFAQLVMGGMALLLYLVRQKANAKIRRAIDMAIGIANAIEKGIPDDTDMKGLKKIDKALRRFVRDWENLHKKDPANWLVVIVRGAVERWVADQNSGRRL